MVLPGTIIRNVEAVTDSPQRNPAVRNCCSAATRALKETQKQHRGDSFKCADAAVTAYRDAMPSLEGYENIRDYIACVAHGMLLGVIDPLEGPKFLYAAQIALSVLQRRPKRIKTITIAPKSQTPPPSPTVAPQLVHR